MQLLFRRDETVDNIFTWTRKQRGPVYIQVLFHTHIHKDAYTRVHANKHAHVDIKHKRPIEINTHAQTKTNKQIQQIKTNTKKKRNNKSKKN